ncbi:hypothetical protein P3T21_006501 [Paraburkholderia sp. GAS334]
MGDRHMLDNEARILISSIAGSFMVQESWSRAWRLYLGYLQLRGLLPEQMKDTPLHTLGPFVQFCIRNEIGAATIANVLAAIRACLRQAGVDPATIPSNRKLAVPRRDRARTPRP